MPDDVSIPRDAPTSSPSEASAELQQALDSAELPDDERRVVENTLRRETPPDADEVLAGDAEDAVLGTTDPEEPLAGNKAADPDSSDLDAVLASGDADEANEQTDEGPAKTVEENLISQESLDELIAAAEADAATRSEEDPAPSQAAGADEPAVSQDLLDSLLADVEHAPPPKPEAVEEPAPVVRPSVVGRPVPSHSLRLIASITIGVFGAIIVFYVLSTHRLRPLTEADLASTVREGKLASAVEAAQALMAEGRYSDAADRLQSALAEAPQSALKVDGEFLYLQAVSKTLPDRIPAEAARAYHSEVDRLIELAPLHPMAPVALHLNAQVYEAEQNPLAARALYRDILEEYPDAANADEVLLAAGRLELALERPVTASDYFEQLIASYPASPLVDQARLHMGDALQLAGNYDGARITYVRLAQAYPGTELGDAAFERLGRLAFETGDYESAIRELESRLAMATTIEGNDRIYLLLAKTHAVSGHPEKALELLRELIEFFPDSAVMPFAYIELSKVQSLMGMARDATRTATQAVDRYPGHADVLRNAGDLLARADRHGEAAAAYEDAFNAGAREPELLLKAGELYGRAELYADAQRVLDALRFDHATAPEALDGTIVWSKLQFERGEVSEALTRLETLADVTRDRSQQFRIKSVLADLYERIGFQDEAARIYAEIPEVTDEPAMLAQSALALFATGSVEEGLGVAERVEVARLSDAEAYRFLVAKGNALMSGELRQALDTLETAHEVYPLERTPEGDALLLRANLAAGRTARARAVMVDMRAQFEKEPGAAEWLTQAANEWGDFLYSRRDYRAAADAYSYATSAAGSASDGAEAWALYQRANALYKMADFAESLRLYEQVSQGTSPWAAEAESKIDAVKLDMKLRGLAVPETQEAG